MILTEAELRELYQNGKGQIPPFPEGTRFTPAALDFLNELRRQGAVLSTRTGVEPPQKSPARSTGWDHPAAFPVDRSTAAKGLVNGKPDELTQIDARHFGEKSDPRIVLRGRLDTLNAFFLLTASLARRQNQDEMAKLIDTLGAYCREIASAEYNQRRPEPLYLAGMDEDTLHTFSHHPEKLPGQTHLMPDSSMPELLLWLNSLRALTREVELCALPLKQPDLVHALNRLSSAVYVLELIFDRASKEKR